MIGLVVLIACMVFYYRAFEMDGRSGVAGAILSFLAFGATGFLGGGLIMAVVGQVVLYFLIAAFRVYKDSRK